MTEAKMWAKIKKLRPLAERIESSVTSGFPDCVIPTHGGWVAVELKVSIGNYIYLQKSQLSFITRMRRAPVISRPHVLVYCAKRSGYRILMPDDIIQVAEPDGSKVRVPYDSGTTHFSLDEALAMMDP